MTKSCIEPRGKRYGLSSLQLETVNMVGRRHSEHLSSGMRAGYFMYVSILNTCIVNQMYSGDGTGVGKGRQIAAVIADNFLKGRKKAIWFSASNTLEQVRYAAFQPH